MRTVVPPPDVATLKVPSAAGLYSYGVQPVGGAGIL